MKVVLAESAGFCYGVRRAVELAEEQAARGGNRERRTELWQI